MARRRPKPASVDGIPAELVDPDAPVWHDLATFTNYMRAHGWPLPAADRIGQGTHPENRRRRALLAWSMREGIASGALSPNNTTSHNGEQD